MHNRSERSSFNSALGAEILEDPDLAQWFFELCIGRTPQVKVSMEILGEMEKSGFVEKTDAGFKLGSDGKEFARRLGLISGKDPLDLVPDLLDYMMGRSSEASGKDKKRPSKGNKEDQ